LATQQITIGLFEATKIIGQTLANNLRKLFGQYGLRNKIITYVKDEGSNLNIMTIVLKFVVKFEVLGLDESFYGVCFGHAFSKECQHAIIDEIVCKNLKFVSIKSTKSNLQKCITWLKKSRNTIIISGIGPPLFTWHIFKILMDFLSPIVTACVLNQSKSH
jgi:hypothetical protein